MKMNWPYAMCGARDASLDRIGANLLRLLLLVETSLTALLAHAAPGDFDTAFSTDGKRTLSFFNESSRGHAVMVRPDGKIAVAGHKGAGMSHRFVIALYNSDGTLDQSFGVDGQAVADFANTGDVAKAIAVQSDGKFVLAGECNDGTAFFVMCLARFEAANKGYRECSLDLDGDGKVLATTDSLIHTRIALGITGSAVIGGITFPANATRNSWSEIRTFLVSQCGMMIAP